MCENISFAETLKSKPSLFFGSDPYIAGRSLSSDCGLPQNHNNRFLRPNGNGPDSHHHQKQTPHHPQTRKGLNEIPHGRKRVLHSQWCSASCSAKSGASALGSSLLFQRKVTAIWRCRDQCSSCLYSWGNPDRWQGYCDLLYGLPVHDSYTRLWSITSMISKAKRFLLLPWQSQGLLFIIQTRFRSLSSMGWGER